MSSATGKRRSARRAEIVEATLRVIAARGVDAVTHRAVAAEAGVSLASTTYYFDSKEALVGETLELVIERSTELVRQHARRPPGGDDLVEQLVALVKEQLDDASAPLAAQYELLLEAGRRPALRPLAARWDEAYAAAVTALVGGAGLGDDELAAEILIDAMEGALLGFIADPRDDFAEAVLRPRLERLVHALTKP
jgi:TetR/AcrR family transcriptional regulator, regulator of biofilm formation and stress response